MSDNLVMRLRNLSHCDSRSGEPLGKCMREAADRIEALQAEKDRLALALIEARNDLFEIEAGDMSTFEVQDAINLALSSHFIKESVQ